MLRRTPLRVLCWPRLSTYCCCSWATTSRRRGWGLPGGLWTQGATAWPARVGGSPQGGARQCLRRRSLRAAWCSGARACVCAAMGTSRWRVWLQGASTQHHSPLRWIPEEECDRISRCVRAPTIRPTITLRARKPLDFAGLKHEDTKKQHSEAVWQFNAGSNNTLHELEQDIAKPRASRVTVLGTQSIYNTCR